jgi:hypothetical protein
MQYHASTDDLVHIRTEIEHKWRETTQRSIQLYLTAKDESDIATVAEINDRFDSVLADLESPLRAPDLYDDLIAMFA